MFIINNNLKLNFLLAFLVRLSFTICGVYYDKKIEEDNQLENAKITPKYTDIDYQVFTDAARHVYQGDSPYDRDTYRYTPILAIILQPNIFLHDAFGKILFVLFDLICGWLIIKINNNGSDSKAVTFWFYNPITIAISSRGNAESLMAFLVLIFIYYLKRRNYFLAGLFYALAVHFKIYPIIYTLAVLFYITKPTSFNVFKWIWNRNLIVFGITFLATFTCLTGIFYLK